MFNRILKVQAPLDQSWFLWGARQTGKSSFLKQHFSDSLYFDFLQTKTLLRYTKSPHLLTEDLLAQPQGKLNLPVILDEIQKVPLLLNEVHWLIENKKISFILCGSSARKLKTESTNLLGGRAWVYHFYPLVFPEVPNIDLIKVFQCGLLPKHYLSEPEYIFSALKSYVDVYLKEEIRNEGLVRDLAGFSRFLDVAGLSSGDMLNFSNIARDCHVDRNTVRGYFEILVDTWLGYYVYPYAKKIKRDLIAAQPKFYLFDVGVTNYLAARTVTELRGEAAGKSLEHYILMELWAFQHMHQKRFTISYWRTKTGLEVDFVLVDAKKAAVAIEVKISAQVHKEDLSGLIAFCDEHPDVKAFAVSQDAQPRKLMIDEVKFITILPWREFLSQLWREEII